MKKLIALGMGLVVLGAGSMAFAAPPCGPNTPKGNICTIGDKNYKSCGDGTFLLPAGSPTSACDATWIVRYDPNGNPIDNTVKPVKTKSEVAPQ